jgi:hypothetical protein
MNCRKCCVLAVVIFIAGCEKARLDEQVRELCAKDGGIKVYETVKLPPDKFDTFGVAAIPEKRKAGPTDLYHYEMTTAYLRKGSPDMRRVHVVVVRRGDGRVLGETVTYHRRGGDLGILLPLHDSSFSCPNNQGLPELKRQLFRRAD